MAQSAGTVYLNLQTNTTQFGSQMSGLKSIAAKLGAALAGAFAVSKLAEFGKACIDLGSDLNEVQNVVDVTFPTMNAQVDQFAKNAAAKFGLSETMAKKFTGTFGSMAEAFGFTEKQSASMAETLTGLSGDVASFYNISQDEAYTKLKSVFSGETESLKDLGVVMTQNALDQYALANGYGKTTSSMTEQEKVALRLAFVQSQLKNASGDFARTSDSWANQVRLLSLQFDSLRATIGQGLILALSGVLKWINGVMSGLMVLANKFKSFMEMVTGKKASTASSASAMSSDLSSASSSASNLGTSAKKASTGVSKAAKAAASLKRSLMGFDQMNKVDAKDSTSSTGSAGSTAGTGTGTSAASSTGSSGNADKSVKGFKMPKALQASLEKFQKSFSRFAGIVKNGFVWIWDNVLVPLGKWTINKLAPKLLDVLSGAFDVLSAACNALAPYWQWLWDHMFKKLAKFAGDAIITFLTVLAGALEKLSGWISKHPKAFDAIVTGFLAFKGAQGVIGIVGKFTKGFEAFKLAWGGAGTVQEAMEATGGKIGFFGKKLVAAKDSFGKFKSGFSVFSGGVKKIGGGFVKVFASIGKGIGRAFMSLLTTNPMLLVLIAAIAAAVVVGILLYKNWDKIKAKLEPLGKLFKAVGKVIGDKFLKIIKTVAKFLKNTFLSAINGVKGAIGAFSDIWNGIKDKAVTLVAEAKEKAEGAMDKIKGVWDSFQDTAVGKMLNLEKDVLFEDTQDIWESIKTQGVAKTVSLIKHKAWSRVKEAWDIIKNSAVGKTVRLIKSKAFEGIRSIWRSIKNSDAVKTLKTKGSSALKKAKDLWGSFKSKSATLAIAFKDYFTAGIKKAWNAIASGINGAIKIINKIPGVQIGYIPKLAQGGYVKKNTPQLAMIGDNRHQGEVVAPENKLAAMAQQAASLAGGSYDAAILSILKEILALIKALDLNVYLDGKPIKDRIVTLINQNTKANGGVCEIKV